MSIVLVGNSARFGKLMQRSQGSLVGVVTRLRAGRSGVRKPAGGRDSSFVQNIDTGFGTTPVSFSLGAGVLSWG